MKREQRLQVGFSGLAAAEIRKARSLLAEFERSPSTSYKSAVMTLGGIKFHLDAAGKFCDDFNHYIGEKA